MATRTLSKTARSSADTGLGSPTLTNPDMILPNGHGDRYRTSSPSPPPDREMPPSPPHIRLKALPESSQARDHRRQRLSREILRHADSEAGSSNARKRLSAKASAPALKTQDSFEMAKKRLSIERKWSDGSEISINSEELERMRWPRSHENGVGEDDDYDERGIADLFRKNPTSTGEDEDIGEGDSRTEEDQYTSMSRRAEIILANAKKRLNLMEGNLRGARTSLMSPTPYSLNRSSPDGSPTFTTSFNSPGVRNHSSLGFSPKVINNGQKRNSSAHVNGNPGHGRNFSDSHTPSRSLSLSIKRNGQDWRSPMTPDKSLDNKFLLSRSLRGTRSSELLADAGGSQHPLRKPSLDWSPPTNLDTLQEDENQSNGSSNSTPLRRSPSTTSELRSQMYQLKGRISSLRERTIEDNMRRRSMQSARIPSPFTDAEAWYTAAETYQGQPLNTNAGVGYSPTEPNATHSLDQQPHSLDPSLEEGATPDATYTNPYSSLPVDPRLGGQPQQKQPQQQPQLQTQSHTEVGDTQLSDDMLTQNRDPDQSVTGESHYEDAEENVTTLEQQTTPKAEDERFKTSYFDDYDEDVEEPRTATRGSFDIPHTRNVSRPVSDRHEDRADAFDYEHFFLHSAMGTIGQGSRRESSSSTDSVETTKGPAAGSGPETQTVEGAPETPQALRDIESRMHKRSESSSSVSTMATFATATEGLRTPADEKEEGDGLPDMASDLRIANESNLNGKRAGLMSSSNFPKQPGSSVGTNIAQNTRQQSLPAVSRPRSQTESAANFRARSTSVSISSSSLPKIPSTMSSKPWISPVVTPVVQALLSSTRPAIKLEKRDEVTLRILIESLREVCLRLSEGPQDADGGTEFRRRLEEARRVLDGRPRY
ncbi:MAG: hypothetical protein M1820_006880 [Bogoriella megaspora]|nr:MAG: hypothetical protein M1820_006880 [Bogoriella megaspora]